jgi:hypothetical protein
MSKQKLMAVVAAGALALTVAAPVVAKGGPPAGVGKGAPPAGIQCQQAGIATLQALKFDGKPLLATVAKAGVEVVGFAKPVPFRTVLFLHRTQPELFSTETGKGVTVVLPVGTTLGGDAISGPVPAFWCDFLFDD